MLKQIQVKHTLCRGVLKKLLKANRYEYIERFISEELTTAELVHGASKKLIRQERSGPQALFRDLATSLLPCTPVLAYLIRLNHIENLWYIYF